MATITYSHHVRGLCLHVVFHKRNIYFSIVYTTLELGRGESPELNTASQDKVNGVINLLKAPLYLVVPSMVKAGLQQVYRSLPSRVGDILSRVEYIELFQALNGGAWK